jgi:hypothetical protein
MNCITTETWSQIAEPLARRENPVHVQNAAKAVADPVGCWWKIEMCE